MTSSSGAAHHAPRLGDHPTRERPTVIAGLNRTGQPTIPARIRRATDLHALDTFEVVPNSPLLRRCRTAAEIETRWCPIWHSIWIRHEPRSRLGAQPSAPRARKDSPRWRPAGTPTFEANERFRAAWDRHPPPQDAGRLAAVRRFIHDLKGCRVGRGLPEKRVPGVPVDWLMTWAGDGRERPMPPTRQSLVIWLRSGAHDIVDER